MQTTVTTKGQVTIPKRARERLGIVPGDKVEFDYDPKANSLVLTKPGGERVKNRFESIVGRADLGMTTDQIMKLLRGDDDGL